MTDEMKPIKCGCGGEAIVKKHTFYRALPLYSVKCEKCGIQVPSRNTEAEAVTVWSRAMSERTAKVVSVEKPIIGDEKGKTIKVISCENCENVVSIFDNFCSNCGARLEWE